MEFINIPRWSAKDVADWMKGLDTVLQPYIETVLIRGVTGDRILLMTTSEELEELGMHKIGHQEIMLDAIGLLVNLHYHQSVDNLQLVTLNLTTRTNCLTKTLVSRSKNGNIMSGRNGTSGYIAQSFPASILVLVAEVVTAVKTVISWLDRPPFVTGDHFFKVFREDILKLALDLTRLVQDTGNLSELEEKLLEISQELGDLSDNLVKKASDPLIIQTSTIDFVSVKKKLSEEELGLEIRTSAIDGTHLITQIKPQSAAGTTDKIHIGDEILQVNYQTVVGWHHSKVIEALKSNASDITLTLKKRPRHLSQPGQIQRPKAIPLLHPNTNISSLPIRRPTSASRKRAGVRDDMYLPPREPEQPVQTEEEEEEERPPDTPCMPDSPLDSPCIDASFKRPTAYPFSRRPTMVPGIALARRNKLARLYRPRSLPSDLDRIKDLDKTLGSDSSKPVKILPLPDDMEFPKKKVNGQIWDTEPTPNTNNDLLVDKAEERIQPQTTDKESSVPPPPPTRKVTVSFKDQVIRDSGSRSRKNIDKPMQGSGASVRDHSLKGILQDDGEMENTNNNEDAQVPRAVQELLVLVTELGEENDDDFVHVSLPGPHEVDGPGRSKKPGMHIPYSPSVSSQLSATSVDSTDSISEVKLRPKKTKSRPKIQITRGVSCVDLGPGECNGYLHKKMEHRTIGPKWAKMWFVLKEFVLYYYKDNRSEKAKGVVCLPGCQVVVSPDSSRSHAFKITHEGIKDICLKASNTDDLKNWVEKLQLASIMYKDESKMRQSRIITENLQKQIEQGLLRTSETGGYHSESTDDDISRSGNFDITHTSPDSCSISNTDSTGSQAGSITSTDAVSALAGIEESSADEFVEEWKKINNVTVTGLERGTSFRVKKKERPSLRIPKQNMTLKAQKSYEKNMLLRKLKAKQSELESVDRLLKQPVITSAGIQVWNDQHNDILACLGGQSEHSSDSDPESGQDAALSSSMSSINTTSTTGQDVAEDISPVSEGTTSGCDVNTPISDTSTAFSETGDKTLTSDSNVKVKSSTQTSSDSSKVDSSLVLSNADDVKDSRLVFTTEETSIRVTYSEDGSVSDSERCKRKASETSL